MFNSVRPHRQQPTRLSCPWDSPGKNTGVGCHFLLQCMKVKSESEVTQLCLTLRDSMECSLPGSSVHGIFQARVLEWGCHCSIAHTHKTKMAEKNDFQLTYNYVYCNQFGDVLFCSTALLVCSMSIKNCLRWICIMFQ